MSNPLKELQHHYQQYRFFVLSLLLLLIAALAAFFLYRPIVIFILAVAVIFHLSVLRPCQKRYCDAVTAANLRQTICKELGTENIGKQGGHFLTINTLEQALLMPCKSGTSSPLLCWELRGENNGFPLTLCDATLPQEFRLTEKGKRRIHFNSGIWTHIDLPVDTQMNIRLLNETSVPTPIRMQFFSHMKDYETASIHHTELATQFVLYRPKNTEQQPSAAMLQNLMKLAEYSPGYIALSINNNQMDLFIRGRFLARPVSVSQKPTQALLDFNPFPELPYIIGLVKTVSK